jgi:hypothetical protein
VQAALGIAQLLVNKYGRVFFVNRMQAALGTYRPTACRYIDHWGSDGLMQKGLAVRRCSPNQIQVILYVFYFSQYWRRWGCFDVEQVFFMDHSGNTIMVCCSRSPETVLKDIE